MNQHQAETISKEFAHVRERIRGLAKQAMPPGHQQRAPSEGQEEALRELIVEGLAGLIVTAGSLAQMNLHLAGIHEELKKANGSTGNDAFGFAATKD